MVITVIEEVDLGFFLRKTILALHVFLILKT